MKKKTIKILTWLGLFSIAMGYMEAAVVVYLRELFYADGFTFPLSPVSSHIATVEFWREAGTIIMLVAAGILAGGDGTRRFGQFLYCFGIWDLMYYVFLKVYLGWPESLMTWDILFLIPFPWVGPVLAPCIVSISMIMFCILISYLQDLGYRAPLRGRELTVLISGCLVIILSFMWDYIMTVPTGQLWVPGSDSSLFKEAETYVPNFYNWWIFLAGMGILVLGVWMYYRRAVQEEKYTIAQPGVQF